jgi:hypothetical protein
MKFGLGLVLGLLLAAMSRGAGKLLLSQLKKDGKKLCSKKEQ